MSLDKIQYSKFLNWCELAFMFGISVGSSAHRNKLISLHGISIHLVWNSELVLVHVIYISILLHDI